MSSSLTLSFAFNTPLSHSHRPLSQFSIISKPSYPATDKSHICFSLSSSNNSNYEREESRWLREEQRWLREEERWHREEARWNTERESLIRQISDLKLRIKEMENQSSGQGTNMKALIQALKLNQISESGSSSVPMVMEANVDEVVVKEVVRVSEKEEVKKRATLRKGSQGDEVHAMQEALQQLGFYCGEEDTEYFSFAGGTERAIKTWQATIGVPEDGIMTAELLERLYIEQKNEGLGLRVNAPPEGNDASVPRIHKFLDLSPPQLGANGEAVASVTKDSEIQQKLVEEGIAKYEESHQGVYLLGENRWEDPSRLSGYKNVGGTKSWNSATQCVTCRGEGRLLCTECDGTGEPNIEEQFMDWVEEGTKCPYCEGLGYTICDVCEGTTLIKKL